MPVSPLRRTDPTEIGGYPIAARLGAGGMGVVYLANGPAGRPLAIKLISLRVAGEPDFRLRFRREVDAARAVGGACAVRLVAADPDAPRPWLATEYVAGSSLAEVVDTEGALPAAVLDQLAVGLAEALHAMHQAGVVHRDLKPSNVILSATGPKVIDFGVSRLAEATPLTGPGSILGSPGYMAPEQVAADQIGPAADVFSWALTIAFASTGRPPYGLGRPEVLLYRVIAERPDIVGVPERLEPVIQAALRHDPAARPTAAALLRWLLPDAADPAEETARLLDERWRLTGHAAQAAAPLPATRAFPPHPAATPAGPAGAHLAFVPAPHHPAGPEHPPSGPRATLSGQAMPPAGPGMPPSGRAMSPSGPGMTPPASGVGSGGTASRGQPPPGPGSVAPAREQASSGPADRRPEPARPARRRRRSWLSSQWIPVTIAVVGVLTVTIVAMIVTSGGGAGPVVAGGASPTPPAVTRTAATVAPTAPAPAPTPTTAPTSSTPSPPPVDLNGRWRGTYTCTQGLTGMLLTIITTPTHDLWARLDFYAVPSNPGVPSGSYLMRVIYTEGVANFSAERWITQPEGYQMANLTARPRADRPNDLDGRVRLPRCTTFALHRQIP